MRPRLHPTLHPNPYLRLRLRRRQVIVVNGFGGLLVAIVIKYTDNIWKGFATAGAIVLTGAVAPILDLGPPPSSMLLGGAIVVVISLFLYAIPATSPTAMKSAVTHERRSV